MWKSVHAVGSEASFTKRVQECDEVTGIDLPVLIEIRSRIAGAESIEIVETIQCVHGSIAVKIRATPALVRNSVAVCVKADARRLIAQIGQSVRITISKFVNEVRRTGVGSQIVIAICPSNAEITPDGNCPAQLVVGL